MKLANLLTIILESWAYPDLAEFRKLDSVERKSIDNGYVLESGDKILAILRQYNVKTTFFIIGELYEWYPDLIYRIRDEGHEIAYHTHTHDRLTSKEVLLDSLQRSEGFLKTFEPKGFCAPCVVFQEGYFDILREYGFRYDCSTYGPCDSCSEYSGIRELPWTTLPLLKNGRPSGHKSPRGLTASVLAGEIPLGSGYFLAMIGKRATYFFGRINKQGNVVSAFLHNWQIVKPKKATFPTAGYLFRHPMYLPYCRDCSAIFEHLLATIPISPIIDFMDAKD